MKVSENPLEGVHNLLADLQKRALRISPENIARTVADLQKAAPNIQPEDVARTVSDIQKKILDIHPEDLARSLVGLQKLTSEIRSEDVLRILTSREAQIVGAGVAGVVLAPVIVPPVLGLFGFSAQGPVAGTAAATIQSSIGNVAAGSAFAVCQSVAAGGALPVGVSLASGLTTAGMYAAAAEILPPAVKVFESAGGFIAATVANDLSALVNKGAVDSALAKAKGAVTGLVLPVAASHGAASAGVYQTKSNADGQ